MQKVITTEAFEYEGRPCPGIPQFIDQKRFSIPILNNYMLSLVFEHGAADSQLTWISYADALLDFFSWLDANGRSWDDNPLKTKHGKQTSNLALYQRWSKDDYRKPDGTRLATSTINGRICRIQFFYKWACYVVELIDFLPFIPMLKDAPLRQAGFMSHTHGRRKVQSSNLTIPEKKKSPEVLNVEEIRELVACPMSMTLRLMILLMLNTGLRNEECRTFPIKYIFDPHRLPRDKKIRIKLDPSMMLLKGNQGREVFISWQMMLKMYEYTQFGEGVERAAKYRAKLDVEPPLLFLNYRGQPWSDNGVTGAFRKLWAGYVQDGYKIPPVLSFRVTPHVLRHTFATHELFYLSQKNGLGKALAMVRDQLGHKSLQTTNRYIHCFGLMEEHELNEYNLELDELIPREKAF